MVGKKTRVDKKVLIVDDEPDILKTLSFILNSEGYEVETAQDGQEALEKAKSGKFDLILLDVVMPGLDGFSFLKMIRTDPHTVNVPVVVVSGRGGMADTFLSFGADGFVVKPIGKETILSEAEKYTRERALLVSGSNYVNEKLSDIFGKFGYEVHVADSELEMNRLANENRYKCVVLHLGYVDSKADQLKKKVESEFLYKDPVLVIYSDSTVKGLENNNTVAIEANMAEWKRLGVTNFFDSRSVMRPFSSLIAEWLS